MSSESNENIFILSKQELLFKFSALMDQELLADFLFRRTEYANDDYVDQLVFEKWEALKD